MFKRPLIAIDIGSSSVKVLEFSNPKRNVLGALGIETFPARSIVDGEIKDPETIAATLQALLRKLGIKPAKRNAAISLNGSSVLIKRAVITPSAETDLADQVFYEAQQLFQHDMDDMYFRYQEIQSEFVGKDRKALVFVGAKRDIVEQRISIIRQLGMRASIVDCDVFCVANVFDANYPIRDAMVVNVNVGAAGTRVIFSFNGEFLFTREFFIGGNEYTEKISKALNVDFNSAEAMKIAASQGDPSAPPHVIQLMNEMNETLVEEIKLTLNFFSQQEEVPEQIKKPGVLFLSGGGARAPGLDATIAAHLQIPVQIVNPFQRLDTRKSPLGMDYLLAHGPIYTVACGLAMRREDDLDE